MPKDSICIIDFCGRIRFSGYSEETSYWADFFPAAGITTFGGAWHDVPDMPCTEEPTEDQALAWVEKSHCKAELRWAAYRRKDEAYNKRQESIKRHCREFGSNYISVFYQSPDGDQKFVSHPCGTIGLADMRQRASFYLQSKLPKGFKLKKLIFESRIFPKELERRDKLDSEKRFRRASRMTGSKKKQSTPRKKQPRRSQQLELAAS